MECIISSLKTDTSFINCTLYFVHCTKYSIQCTLDYMKYIRLSIIFLVLALSACDKDKNAPSLVSPDLNLMFVNGDYITNDADAQLTAVQENFHIYIVFPPDTTPKLIVGTSGFVSAKFRYNVNDRISVGNMMFNGDTVPYNPYYGYHSNFDTSFTADVFKFGANWSFDGNPSLGFSGGSMNNSGNIPTLTLDTVLERYKKAEGLNINIKSTNLNCNKLVVAIKKGDSVLIAKELDPLSTTINLSPNELSALPSNDSYDLIIKAKNYIVMVNNNKKYYYLNEINNIHYFVLD